MKFAKTTAGLLAITLTALLTGCEAEQNEKDMLAEAQYCLDKATATTAGACMDKIEGLTSAQAYALRCAEGFITAGITSPRNLGDAMAAISGTGGTASMLAALSFPDTTAANSTFEACNLSQQNGMALIGAMAKSATVLAQAAGVLGACATSGNCGTALTAQMDALYQDLNSGTPSEATIATIGAITGSVSTVYGTTCSGGTNTNSDICKQINQAGTDANVDVANLTPEERLELGKHLMAQWKQ